MKRLRTIIASVATGLILALGAPDASAQGFLSSIKEKITSDRGAKPKGKAAAIDPLELSLDENLAHPAVPAKKQSAVAEQMNLLARSLSSRRVEKIETLRGGEVVVATISADLLFAPNDTVLRPEAKQILKPYTGLLADAGKYKLVVVTHTDNTGSEYYTDLISEARLHAVVAALTKSPSALGTVIPYALGASEPLLPNNSMANRAANRRVEIYIVPDRQLIDTTKPLKPQPKNK